MSPRKSASSSVSSAGTFSHRWSANGTRMRSAWPPPQTWPKRPPNTARPCRCTGSAAAAGTTRSRRTRRRTARSRGRPAARVVTAAPASSTTPMNSWPMMAPVCTSAPPPRPWYWCRSEPHTALVVMLSRTSVGSTSLGSATSVARTSLTPWNVIAFIATPPSDPSSESDPSRGAPARRRPAWSPACRPARAPPSCPPAPARTRTRRPPRVTRASSGASEPATPPVMTTTSGLRPLTIVPIIAPSARHASSTTAAATASPSAAAAKTISAAIASAWPPAARSSALPRGDARAGRVWRSPARWRRRARQPRLPHQQGGPSKFTGTWPSSPPNPAAPRTSRPSRMMPAPNPVPSASTTSERAPRPCAAAPLGQRQRVDVVVEEDGQPEARGQLGAERPADQLGHVVRGIAHAARRRRPPGPGRRGRCRRSRGPRARRARAPSR